MRINNISFVGVKKIGSVKSQDKDFFEKKHVQIDAAKTQAKIFEKNGVDTFIVKYSNKTRKGENSKYSTTYLLTHNDAKILKKYDEIKQDLLKLYNENYFQSDIFVNRLDEKTFDIDQQKLSLAEFIAVMA